MVGGLLIALAVAGPAGQDGRRADEVSVVAAHEWGPDLRNPFAAQPDRRGARQAVASTRLDLKDPFAAHASRRTTTTAVDADLRDPFQQRGSVAGDEPGCTPPVASNGAVVQRPSSLPAADGCGTRGRPHLVNPFARPPAR